ncbi:MAG: nitroreductase family protein [Oligoflexales bacterium]
MNLEKLRRRYSVKKFDPDRKLDSKTLDVIIDSFYFSPSSLNTQPWKLVVVSDPGVKASLAEAGMDTNKMRIEECSHLLVLMRRKLTMDHIHQVIDSTEVLQIMMRKKGVSRFKLSLFVWFYSRLKGLNKWSTNQLYIALGFVLAACSELEVGALPMEGIRSRKIDHILKLGSQYRCQVVVAIGYPHSDDLNNPSRLRKSRLPQDQVVQFI